MNEFDHKHREKLHQAMLEEEQRNRELDNSRSGKLQAGGASHRTLQAKTELERWDAHVVQVVPAPPGVVMKVTYASDGARRDSSRRWTAVEQILFVGVRRDGLAVPLFWDEELRAFRTADPGISSAAKYELLRDGQPVCKVNS